MNKDKAMTGKHARALERAWNNTKSRTPRWNGVSKLAARKHSAGFKAIKQARYMAGMDVEVEKNPLGSMDAQGRVRFGGPVYWTHTGRTSIERGHIPVKPVKRKGKKGKVDKHVFDGDDMAKRDRAIKRHALSARKRAKILASAEWRMPMAKLDRPDSLSASLIGR